MWLHIGLYTGYFVTSFFFKEASRQAKIQSTRYFANSDSRNLRSTLTKSSTLSPSISGRILSTLNPPGLIVSSEEEITPLPNSESRGVGTAKVANKQPVKSMIIFTQNEDTIIIFSTQEPLEFDIIENEYTNQIIVHLPKTEWTAVESMDKNGGLIESYTVDQEADPKTTNITFNVQKGTNVIGPTVSRGEGQNSRIVPSGKLT